VIIYTFFFFSRSLLAVAYISVVVRSGPSEEDRKKMEEREKGKKIPEKIMMQE
jgi:hypothetical protein